MNREIEDFCNILESYDSHIWGWSNSFILKHIEDGFKIKEYINKNNHKICEYLEFLNSELKTTIDTLLNSTDVDEYSSPLATEQLRCEYTIEIIQLRKRFFSALALFNLDCKNILRMSNEVANILKLH